MTPKVLSFEIPMLPVKAFKLFCGIADEFSHGKKGWWTLLLSLSTLDALSIKGKWRITSRAEEKLVLEMLWRRWFTGSVHIMAIVTQLGSENSLVNLDARVVALFDLYESAEIPTNLIKEAFEKRLISE
jgi:hypothetical protein